MVQVRQHPAATRAEAALAILAGAANDFGQHCVGRNSRRPDRQRPTTKQPRRQPPSLTVTLRAKIDGASLAVAVRGRCVEVGTLEFQFRLGKPSRKHGCGEQMANGVHRHSIAHHTTNLCFSDPCSLPRHPAGLKPLEPKQLISGDPATPGRNPRAALHPTGAGESLSNIDAKTWNFGEQSMSTRMGVLSGSRQWSLTTLR